MRTLILALCLAASTVAAQEKDATIAGRRVIVWEPAASAAGRRPLVVFSHGFSGCAGQSKFLTRKLAEAGYWVVAPNHQDARCGGERRSRGRIRRPEEPFRSPEQWSSTSYDDRAEDVRAIVKALADSAPLRSRLDVTLLAVAGHSLGGYTAIGLAGGWQGDAWSLPNVKAVLALSPYSDPYLVAGRLPSLRAPVMYQTGTRDAGINRSLKRSNGVYDQSPSPKYYIDFDGAAHLAWSDRSDTFHDQIVAYSTAFLDHYVQGKPASPLLTKVSSQVAELRFKSDLGQSRP